MDTTASAPRATGTTLHSAVEASWDFEAAMYRAVLQKAIAEWEARGGSLACRLGIGGMALATLLMLHVPDHPLLRPEDYVQSDEREEQAWVRALLLSEFEVASDETTCLAAIIARRSMDGNHLWEDLGLSDRASLTRLMRMYFPALAGRNVDNMRWKRFFFRQLCDADGLSHCTSPTCCDCPDLAGCFEPGSVEALMAQAKSAPD